MEVDDEVEREREIPFGETSENKKGVKKDLGEISPKVQMWLRGFDKNISSGYWEYNGLDYQLRIRSRLD